MTRGFTALVSVVTIAGFLIAAVATASYAGFYTRASMLRYEGREASRAAARGCAESVRLRLLYEPEYVGKDAFVLDENVYCRIGPIETVEDSSISSGSSRFKVLADAPYARHSTEFDVTIDSESKQVVTVQEIPNTAQ